MRHPPTLSAATILFAALAACQANVPENVAATTVSFKTSDAPRAPVVPGELRLIKDAAGKTPAVVILHSSAGLDGTGARYANELNKAGIATFEIEMFPRATMATQRPSRLSDTYPHMFGALDYLARHPAIDTKRIGVVGFSWGGALAVMSVFQANAKFHADGDSRFAAHVGMYPTCYVLPRLTSSLLDKSWTGAPLLVLAGEKDDYEPPETCPQWKASLPEDQRRLVEVHVYPGATHGWDEPIPSMRRYFDAVGALGKGATITTAPDAKVTADSKRRTVEFFRTAFGMN